MNYSRERRGKKVRDHLREMPSILVSAAESHLSCGQQRGFFAWQWKFMVALLCPNNSHIVSRTDSPCRKQQACYQSHIFAYCVTATPPPLFSLPHCTARQKTENIWGKSHRLHTSNTRWILSSFLMGEATVKLQAVPESKLLLLDVSLFAKTWQSFGG